MVKKIMGLVLALVLSFAGVSSVGTKSAVGYDADNGVHSCEFCVTYSGLNYAQEFSDGIKFRRDNDTDLAEGAWYLFDMIDQLPVSLEGTSKVTLQVDRNEGYQMVEGKTCINVIYTDNGNSVWDDGVYVLTLDDINAMCEIAGNGFTFDIADIISKHNAKTGRNDTINDVTIDFCYEAEPTPASDPNAVSLDDVTVKFSQDSYTYTGQECKPTVTISSGNVVYEEGKDYTIEYMESVGLGNAAVCIKLTDRSRIALTKYQSTMRFVEYKIYPKKPTISVKKGKKQFTVSWSAATGGEGGYQIEYSTNKNFKGKKTVNISTAGKGNKVIKGLKSKKTYYVRVRARGYLSSSVLWGSYSATKKVKTK